MNKPNPVFRRLLITYSIVLAGTTVGYLIRELTGQFDPAFNLVLYYTSIVLVTVAWETLRFINIILNRTFPFERSIPFRIAIQVVVGVFVAIMLRFMVYEFAEPYLAEPIDRMFWAATWFLYILASVMINSIFITRFFIDQWKISLVQAERLEKEKATVQFDNLKNQLNPHFLFNALTSLNSLIFENQNLASQFLQHLSKVYRYVLQNKDKNFVSLQTELDFIQNYVFLLSTRFEKAVTISIKVGEDCRDKAIVPVTLQILIENALKHNVVDKERMLNIDIRTMDDYLIVSNNLQPRKIVETSNKQGLDNLRSLYTFLSGRPVVIGQTADRFEVKVPLI